jgi:uncharacterized protein YukJ
VVIALGEFFQDRGRDSTFGFSPELGVHDIHMMQGNSGSFADDNRINGGGALFIRFTGGETIALFVRFSVQSTTTDERGNPSSLPPPAFTLIPPFLPCEPQIRRRTSKNPSN